MTPEKEQKKGGSRLAGPAAEKDKRPRKKLTGRQKALRAVYITLTVLAALVVAVFAVSKLLFVKPDITPEGGRPETPIHSSGLETETPSVYGSGRKEDFFTFLVIGRDTGSTYPGI